LKPNPISPGDYTHAGDYAERRIYQLMKQRDSIIVHSAVNGLGLVVTLIGIIDRGA
jgi:hypothetical protein